MNNKQKFQERINDKTKPELNINFIRFIKELAKNNPFNENEIFEMWRDYSSKCNSYDQSPVKSEFVQWYKLEANEQLLRNI